MQHHFLCDGHKSPHQLLYIHLFSHYTFRNILIMLKFQLTHCYHLLGADDKAGIAEILTACERIIKENIPHGKICIGFTPDEEIGRGANKFDVKNFGAQFAYTMDGGVEGEISYENFNASAATVEIYGVSVHPGSAKNTMINATNVGIEFDSEGFEKLCGINKLLYYLHNSIIACVNILALSISSSITANSSFPCILLSVPGIVHPNATPFFM
jgi:hypothetical protein